jgi:bacterioferritin-associated ferredoxin
MYVCLCTGVTDTDIRAAIHDGASSAEAVMMATRAGSRCGSCRAEVAHMVAAELAGDTSALAQPRACHNALHKQSDGKRHLDVHGDEAAPRSAA